MKISKDHPHHFAFSEPSWVEVANAPSEVPGP